MALEDHFSGEESCGEWAEAGRAVVGAGWKKWPHRAELIEICGGDDDLAFGIWAVAGGGALEWLDSKPPVLEGRSARQCLKSESGLRRLKTALMRAP
jgi:hypothetical protein